MASTIASIITLARTTLNELVQVTDGFWTDAQLAGWGDKCCKDLWRAINDLPNQDYFLAVDTGVSQLADDEELDGVPDDCSIVRGLEPLDFAAQGLIYENQPYVSTKFQRARASVNIDPASGITIYWAVTGAGAPVDAPIIRVAPLVTSTVPLRLIYVPTLAAITAASNNPIPGESDNAIAAWMVAYALGKESEERVPDPGWLAVYKAEKTNLIVSLTPRADEDDTVAEAFFEDEWQ